MILPTPESPHKETEGQAPFQDRFNMLQLAFHDNNEVNISDLETRLPKPSYTLRTIRHLQDENPDNNYYLCIGEDSLASFHAWWKYEEILNRVPLIVAGRPGANGAKQSQNILDRVIFVDHSNIDISSTDIRKRVRQGDQLISDSVPGAVADYIFENNLYID